MEAENSAVGYLPAMRRASTSSSRLSFLWYLSWHSSHRNRRRV